MSVAVATNDAEVERLIAETARLTVETNSVGTIAALIGATVAAVNIFFT